MTRLCAIAALAGLLAGCARAPMAPVHPDWQLYSNSKYGYQIEYPDGYDLWATGPQGEQDGASIRISLHEYQALTPALDVHVMPNSADWRFPPLGIEPQDLSMELQDVSLNGVTASEVRYRWKATGDLAYVDIDLDGVLFLFMAGPSISEDFHESEWYAIISTFRFTK